MGLSPQRLPAEGGETMTLGITRLGTQTQRVIADPTAVETDARARRHRRRAKRPRCIEVPEPVRRARASCSSRSNGSASAAPTSSCTRARWPTSTRASRTSRSASGTSGPAASSARRRRPTTSWLGRRVTGDTMLGCGRCEYCPPVTTTSARTGSRSASATGGPGALAEKVARAHPVRPRDPRARQRYRRGARRARRQLAAGGAGRGPRSQGTRARARLGHDRPARRAVRAGRRRRGARRRASARARSRWPVARGAAHVAARRAASASAADGSTRSSRPRAIEAMPALSVRLAKPAGRVVFIGLSSTPSLVDTPRHRAQGHHRGRHPLGLARPRRRDRELRRRRRRARTPIVSEVVALEDVPARLEGRRGADAGPARRSTSTRDCSRPEGTPMNDRTDARRRDRRRGEDSSAPTASSRCSPSSPSIRSASRSTSSPASCAARSRPCTARSRRFAARGSPTWWGGACTCSATSTCAWRSATSTAAPRPPASSRCSRSWPISSARRRTTPCSRAATSSTGRRWIRRRARCASRRSSAAATPPTAPPSARRC